MENPFYSDNVVLRLSFEFAVDIIKFTDQLEEKRKYVLARQLLKSGTSIGANVHEAQNCESKADFIHKVKIAAKEGDETVYWLLLCKAAYNLPECDQLLEKVTVVNKIMNKIISTSKRK